MIRTVTMYECVCDRCGVSAHEDYGEYACYSDAASAKENAEFSDWIVIGEHDYCPMCYELGAVVPRCLLW
jgi:hypothetical protein